MRLYGISGRYQSGVMALFIVTWAAGANCGSLYRPGGRPLKPAGTSVFHVAAGVPRLALGRGAFLVASRDMNGPIFARTVVLITHYDTQGTVGIVINRPLGIAATRALPSLSGLNVDPGNIRLGGPVALTTLQILVRSPSAPTGAEPIFDDVYLVNKPSGLRSLLTGNARISALRLFAGYAGWAAGQLESELLEGDWYLWPADVDTIFSLPPESIWRELIDRAAARWAMDSSRKDRIYAAAPGFRLQPAGSPPCVNSQGSGDNAAGLFFAAP